MTCPPSRTTAPCHRQVGFYGETECITFDPCNAVKVRSNLITIEDLVEEGSQRALDCPEPLNRREGLKVLLFCSLLMFFVIGPFITFSFRLYSELLPSKPNHLSLTFLGASSTGLVFIGFPFAAFLADQFGHRPVVLTGVWLTCLGLLLSSFATQLWHLVFTRGILVGLGGALVFSSSFTLPLNWFRECRQVPVASCTISIGLGGMVTSIASEIIFNARIWLQCHAALLFLIGTFATYFLKLRTPSLAGERIIDWKLLKNTRILLLLVIAFTSSLGVLVPLYVFPLFSTSYEISPRQVAVLAACLSGGFALGSSFLGLLTLKLLPSWMILIGLFSGGLMSLTLWLFNENFPVLIIFSVLHGALTSSFFTLSPLTIFAIAGASEANHIFRLIHIAYGAAILIGPPTISAVTGSYLHARESWPYPYLPSVLFTSLSAIFSAFLMLLMKKLAPPRSSYKFSK